MTSSDRDGGGPDAGALRARLDAVMGEGQRRWLDEALAAVRADPAALTARFPAVGRTVGRGPLDPGADPGAVHAWTVDDAARVLLLDAAGAAAADLLEPLYQQGDAAERRAVLRALAVLDRGGGLGGRGVPLVMDAARTSDERLLAAALGPYADRHLDDQAWTQAVLKCVFLGVPLGGVAGIGTRAQDELARMLADYAHERVAAGRDVPADVWPILNRNRPPGLAALEAELASEVPARREAARRALDAMAAAGATGG